MAVTLVMSAVPPAGRRRASSASFAALARAWAIRILSASAFSRVILPIMTNVSTSSSETLMARPSTMSVSTVPGTSWPRAMATMVGACLRSKVRSCDSRWYLRRSISSW